MNRLHAFNIDAHLSTACKEEMNNTSVWFAVIIFHISSITLFQKEKNHQFGRRLLCLNVWMWFVSRRGGYKRPLSNFTLLHNSFVAQLGDEQWDFYVLRKLWNALSVNIYRWMKYLRFFLTPEPLFWNYFNNLTHSIRTWHKLVWWNDFQGDSSALISLLQIEIRWSLQRCIVCISIEWFNCWIIQCSSFLGAIFIPGQICHVSQIKFSME